MLALPSNFGMSHSPQPTPHTRQPVEPIHLSPNPEEDGDDKPQRRFQFIDNNDVKPRGVSSTQVRRHVMQEYMREKRWQARVQGDEVEKEPRRRKNPVKKIHAQGNQSIQAPSLKRTVSKSSSLNTGRQRARRQTTSSSEYSRPESDISEKSTQPPVTPVHPARQANGGFHIGPDTFAQMAKLLPLTRSSPPVQVDSMQPALKRYLRHLYKTPRPAPQINEGGFDPFNCLPVLLSRWDRDLLHFYKCAGHGKMPAHSAIFGLTPKWNLLIFRMAMDNTLAFQCLVVMQAMVARVLTQRLQCAVVKMEIIEQVAYLVRQHVYNINRRTNSTALVLTDICAAMLQGLCPSVEKANQLHHYRHVLQEQLSTTSGIPACFNDSSLRLIFDWWLYTSPYYGYFEPGSPIGGIGIGSGNLVTVQTSLADDTSEFTTFLKCVGQLATVQAGGRNNPVLVAQRQLRYTIFTPGQPLYQILADPVDYNNDADVYLRHLLARLAVVVILNTAIWEYREAYIAGESYLSSVMEEISRLHRYGVVSIEALLQMMLMLEMKSQSTTSERPWFVRRMLRISKRLSVSNLTTLTSFLFGVLTLDTPHLSLIEDWAGLVFYEIHGAPSPGKMQSVYPHL